MRLPAAAVLLLGLLAAPAFADFRGKVVAVTFISTGCPDICPLLTQKMALVQDELGVAFDPREFRRDLESSIAEP
jgi:cytochrome oxidase Cu insertion factor (SCO1/SenC/PrrC family)